MPKTFYTNETDIPADQKGCYELKHGRWELTMLDNDHPVVVTKTSLETTNRTLKTENTDLTAKVSNLEQEKTELSSKSVPHGYRAVKKEVAEVGEVAIAESLTVDSIKALKTENETLKKTEANRTEREIKTRALKAVGIENVDAFFELKASDNLKLETETVDGKEKFFAVIEKDGVKERKSFDTDFLKNTEGFKSLSLVGKKESGFHFGEQANSGNTNIYDRIRANVKSETEANTKAPSIDERFGKATA